jgi:hypothetical protein
MTATATRAGGVVGTRVYMAPELPDLPASSDTDMYSIGIVLLLAFCPELIEDVESERSHPSPEWIEEEGQRLQLYGWLVELLKKLLANPMAADNDELDSTSTSSTDSGSQRASELPRSPAMHTRRNARAVSITKRPSVHQILYDDEESSQFFERKSGGDPAQPLHWKQDGSQLVALNRDDPIVGILRDMIAETQPEQLGIGRDAATYPGWTHLDVGNRHIEFSRAWRLENLEVWGKYQARLTQVRKEMSRGPPLDALSAAKSPPIRRGLREGGGRLPGGLRAAHANDYNETFLMTGVPLHNIASVLENGCNEHFAGKNAGCLFGAGVYFAENIEKCDQYTRYPAAKLGKIGRDERNAAHEKLYGTNQDDVEDDVLYVLVCRVVMGYPIRTRGRDAQHRCIVMDKDASASNFVFHESCREAHYQESVLTGVINPETGRSYSPLLHHHSLIAECGGAVDRFREFVVFDGAQVYPEYVVSYRRTAAPQPSCKFEHEPEPELAA